jgi:hypothetical protein
MGKRNKYSAKSIEPANASTPSAMTSAAPRSIHPPAKQPTLFAVSLILFALWFVFLLVTAVFG